jgi:hypothetical protein
MTTTAPTTPPAIPAVRDDNLDDEEEASLFPVDGVPEGCGPGTWVLCGSGTAEMPSLMSTDVSTPVPAVM